jgi:hypothetical protein
LVHVAVAREERVRVVHDLPDRQVVQTDADDGLEPGALLRVDVHVRERRGVGELDEPDVVVGDRLRPGEVGVAEELPIVRGVCDLPVEASVTTV